MTPLSVGDDFCDAFWRRWERINESVTSARLRMAVHTFLTIPSQLDTSARPQVALLGQECEVPKCKHKQRSSRPWLLCLQERNKELVSHRTANFSASALVVSQHMKSIFTLAVFSNTENKNQSFHSLCKFYVVAYPSKTKQDCQVDVTKLWYDVNEADDFENRGECLKSQLKITAKNKATLFLLWSKKHLLRQKRRANHLNSIQRGINFNTSDV